MSHERRSLGQKLAASFLFVLLLTGGGTGLKDVRVWVPAAVLRGDTATLRCIFDLEGDSLYSVKWYKGGREFYRYTPREATAMKVFPIPGFHVQKAGSNATTVTLEDVSLSSSGKYSCEVSADAPSFHTALVTGEMDVVEVPRERPVIKGLRHRYKVGDVIQANCSSQWSKPAAKLTWIINGVQAQADVVRQYPAEAEAGGGERRRPTLGLRLPVTQDHMSGGRLKVRCTASIHDVYWQIVEKSVEAERPRWLHPYTELPQPPHPQPGLRLDNTPLDAADGKNTPVTVSRCCPPFRVSEGMLTFALLCIMLTSR